MEVTPTRNGRYTIHEVTLDLDKPDKINNKATQGVLWISRVVITYQYLWSDGTWHVLHAKVAGRRNATTKTGPLTIVKMYRPENWPNWLHGEVLKNTPIQLSPPETLK
jgi:hypothetical protein